MVLMELWELKPMGKILNDDEKFEFIIMTIIIEQCYIQYIILNSMVKRRLTNKDKIMIIKKKE